MIGHERHGLVGVIGGDLIRNAKIPLILLIAVLVSAVLVVTTAHRTRLLTAEREQLVLERDALDIEWRNLILEENALGDHSRVERIAIDKLKMQHVDPSQENIVVKP
ncbi:cell division protein FtsL [Yersinia pekkanenii]|uniref:Cell division protein FtsL n=1 Tax=Yersinia pekkanenii TaxID=1288385 RepID=A0A0T9PVJ9_9GAMM|nr:cell division protein FtsL [Yersinia pekkanenii]CNH83922.1 cell division protein FtsL [Yersinia pekkanenii]CRY63302.1 cell division protein FtsL [Yersinia pekkanenii]